MKKEEKSVNAGLAAGERRSAARGEVPQCAAMHGHTRDEVLRAVGEGMPAEDDLYDLAELFKVFGDSTRVRILYALHESELCVCDIAGVLGMTLSAISHQLRILKSAGLVKYRRNKKTVFYSLADDHVHTILGQGMEHVLE